MKWLSHSDSGKRKLSAMDLRQVSFELHFQCLRAFALKKACNDNISEERVCAGRDEKPHQNRN